VRPARRTTSGSACGSGGDLDHDALVAACTDVAARHPALGLAVTATDGTPRMTAAGRAPVLVRRPLADLGEEVRHGRVFAVHTLFAWCTLPIGFVAVGSALSGAFQPLLQPGGALAGSVGTVIGTGAGRGGSRWPTWSSRF